MKAYTDYKKRARIRRINSFLRREWFELVECFFLGVVIGMTIAIYLYE